MNAIGPSGEIYKPTLTDAKSHDPQGDADRIRAALRAFGTDEYTIIDILGERSYKQRINIKKLYEKTYGRPIEEDIKKECGGTFGKILLALFLSPAEVNATFCRDAMKTSRVDKEKLATIIGSATNKEIKELKEAFKKMFEKDLVEEIKAKVDDDFEKVLVSLLQGDREEPNEAKMKEFKVKGIEALVDLKKDRQLAQELFDAGEGKKGTDLDKFIPIICKQSVWNIAAIDHIYHEIARKSIADAIALEIEGPVATALICAVRGCLDRPGLYAELIHDPKIEDVRLIRLLIARSEIDLGSIKAKFEEKYKKTLKERVDSAFSAYAEKLMFKIIGE